ncbi:UvrB/UvrC motif-containing protein [Bhargavaea cecembensis]|uniref:UvrB/UvrC motif-containing protein n=1 Tax=Bhargavaea cecembensis TaxID=394098 RepID=UPI00058CE4D5|nr:UvrB/UvrC motif-containing protein [Bhargavaea cecembensis]
MICDHCHERPASVVVTQSNNGKTQERHLCDVCASHFHPLQGDFGSDPFGIQQFLSNWFGGTAAFGTEAGRPQSVEEGSRCPSCGLTFRRFLERGKFGCPECYDAFRGELPAVFRKVQNGHVEHTGKVPESFSGRVSVERKIGELRGLMQEAIEAEEFEEAARVRDEIRGLERSLERGGDRDDID